MNIKIAEAQDRKAVFALRHEVFVLEQRVPPEIEIDSEDGDAVHILALEGDEAVGCARIVFGDGGAHIGRLAVKKTHRGTGVGSEICRFTTEYCHGLGHRRIWLNSQLHAVGFYEKLGFKPIGEAFFEAGIEHIEMEIISP